MLQYEIMDQNKWWYSFSEKTGFSVEWTETNFTDTVGFHLVSKGCIGYDPGF